VDFDLSDLQTSCRTRAGALGRELALDASAPEAIAGASRAGLLDPGLDLLGVAVAVEALAFEHASAAIAFALHGSVLRSIVHAADPVDRDARAALAGGTAVGALAMSSDEVPVEDDGRLVGRASWVAPLTGGGFVMVGARGASGSLMAWLTRLDAPGVRVEPVAAAGLRGLVCGHVSLVQVAAIPLGATQPVMGGVRILLAAAGLGMGRRAMRESLEAARAYGRTGAGGEQTAQGLLADAATELDAAKLLTWKAASASTVSLAEASMAKLAATEATQRAVARATQIVGSESFRDGHPIGRLARDVRALELFAGRTEALREAVALDTLPRPD
jgi:alkylation response protein AidB-like acyl-CoA dehydrogenase